MKLTFFFFLFIDLSKKAEPQIGYTIEHSLHLHHVKQLVSPRDLFVRKIDYKSNELLLNFGNDI